MQDLADSLRAKLDEMVSEKRINKRDRDNTSQFATGFESAVREMRRCLKKLPDGWHSLLENPADLPEHGLPVLLLVTISLKAQVILKACWMKTKTEEDCGGSDYDFGEYDEATDRYYWPEGWYEWNQSEETHFRVQEDVLGWSLMPPIPDRFKK